MSLIFFGRIAQAVLALLALRIMTTMLSPEEMGRWSLLLAVTSFFVLGLVNPLGMFINRRLHGWVRLGKIKHYMAYYFAYLVVIALFAASVLYVVSFFYGIVPGMPLSWVIGLVAGAIVFATLNQTYTPSLNLLGYRGWFVLLTLATVAISLLVSVMLVYWVRPNAELWQSGQLIGQFVLTLLGGLLFFHFAKRHKEKDSDPALMRISAAKLAGVFAFAWPLAISVMLTWVQTQSYRFIVQDIIGLQVLGLFVVGYGVSMSLIGVFESIISTYFMPMFYKRVSSERKHEQALAWREYAAAMLPSLLLAAVVIISMSDELAFVLLDTSFSQAAQYIVWGALAEIARVIVATYALLAHAGMDTKKLILPNIFAAAVAPVLILMLVADWGAHGVGMGLAIAGGGAIVFSHLLLSRSFEIIMPWWSLVQAALTAAGLFLIIEAGHASFGMSTSFIGSFLSLVCVGILLLGILFAMLRAQIKREAI